MAHEMGPRAAFLPYLLYHILCNANPIIQMAACTYADMRSIGAEASGMDHPFT